MSLCNLSIIIVAWNVWPLLTACLRSIEQVTQALPGSADWRSFGPPGQPATVEVIVVDNASQDETVQALPKSFPWVRLIASPENLGFTGGNNLGYGASRGRFLYFLNPDTELDHGATHRLMEAQPGVLPPPYDSLWQLYAAIQGAADIGMVGPQLRYGDGSPQPSARRLPTPLTGFFESTWLGRSWPTNPWAQRLHMADWPVAYRHDADWLVGAAMLCRRTALEATLLPAGPFDERFFMYSEEMDLGSRLRAAGWRVVYAPEAVVVHHEGKSSEQVTAARHIYFNTSKVRYAAKWFGPAWAALLRRYLLLEFRLQLWQETIKGLLGHKRELRQQRVAVYREVLASGLR